MLSIIILNVEAPLVSLSKDKHPLVFLPWSSLSCVQKVKNMNQGMATQRATDPLFFNDFFTFFLEMDLVPATVTFFGCLFWDQCYETFLVARFTLLAL